MLQTFCMFSLTVVCSVKPLGGPGIANEKAHASLVSELAQMDYMLSGEYTSVMTFKEFVATLPDDIDPTSVLQRYDNYQKSSRQHPVPAGYTEMALVADQGNNIGTCKNTISVATCAKFCDAKNGCQSFSYQRRNDGTSWCWLKDKEVTAGSATNTADWVQKWQQSGEPFNTYYKSSATISTPNAAASYDSRPLLQEQTPTLERCDADVTADDCAAFCDSLDTCNSFAFGKDPRKPDHVDQCYLKDADLTTIESATANPKPWAQGYNTYYK